ncbi:hypothetical protein [Halococcoides cellulosivorans]|nr:hypothetical protein [Halococcoides cellulosivorans]
MVMGRGTPLDGDAIVAAVSAIERRLGDCVHDVAYRNTRDGPYETACLTPREARLTLVPGIDQRGGYLDVQWWENGDYKYHYREEGLTFRFGREEANAETDDPIRHFHPPDDRSAHEPSAIAVTTPERVSIAVGTAWISAVRTGDPDRLNDGELP